jgi:hypothetical protein
LLWLLLNYKLFGLSPAGWHVTSLLIHLLATWLVFVLAKRLTSDYLVAALAALLFGIHPAHIEAVAWVSGITDSLMTLFFVATVILYLKSRTGSRASLLLSLLFYSLSILTKEPAVVFVPLILCYELLVGKKEPYTRFLKILPFLLVTGVYFIVRVKVLGGLGHQLTSLPISTLALTIPSVLWFYVNHLVWPLPLSAFYDATYVSGGWLFWGPLAGVLSATIIYVILARHSALVLFLGCWVLLPILPLLNLSLFKFGEIVHDRYLYLPSVAFCIVISIALCYVIRDYAKYKLPAVVLLVVVSTAWALETVIEVPQWKNDLALYTHGAAVAPRNNIVINNLASTLKDSGNTEGAIFLSKQVLARDPDNWLSLYNLGHSYYKIGNFDQAIKLPGASDCAQSALARPILIL